MTVIRALRFSLLLCLFFAPDLHAQRTVFDIGSIPDLDFGQWEAGDGNRTDQTRFCVRAKEGGDEDEYFPTLTSSAGGSGTDFYLSSGSDLLVIDRVEWGEVDGGEFKNEKRLQHASERDDKHKGTKKNCNGRITSGLEFRIERQDLEAVPPGIYSATFTFEGRAEKSNRRDSETFIVQIEVVGSGDQVRVSGLSDISLESDPTSDGDLNHTEGFCVYSSVGGYSMTITSTVEESGGFGLDGGALGTVPLRLEFDDNPSGGGWEDVAPGVSLSGNGDTSADDCGGSDNARIRLTISNQALRQAKTGTYTSTLTFLVEPP